MFGYRGSPITRCALQKRKPADSPHDCSAGSEQKNDLVAEHPGSGTGLGLHLQSWLIGGGSRVGGGAFRASTARVATTTSTARAAAVHGLMRALFITLVSTAGVRRHDRKTGGRDLSGGGLAATRTGRIGMRILYRSPRGKHPAFWAMVIVQGHI